jgi:hypothetical protein
MTQLDLLKEISQKLDRQNNLLEQLAVSLKSPRIEIQIHDIEEDEARRLAADIEKAVNVRPQ